MAGTEARFAALQHRDFRLLWASNFVSIIGTQMQLVAINWHIYTLLAGATLSICSISARRRWDWVASG